MGLSKKVKKKIILWLLGAGGAFLPVILVVILVFAGITAAVSSYETLSLKDIKTAEELQKALRWPSKISKDELDDMMIDRKGLKRIVDEVIKWNSGKWQTDDRMTVKLTERTEDYYTTTDVVSSYVTVTVYGYDHGGDNSTWVSVRVPTTVLDTKTGKKSIQYKTKQVWVSSFRYLYEEKVDKQGNVFYVKSRNGSYVPYNGGYAPVCSYIYHEEEEIRYETVTTKHEVTFDVSSEKKTTAYSSEYGKKYTSLIRTPASTKGPTWNIKVRTESLYKDYPIDWQIIYMFCVYNYIDENEMEDAVDTDYDTDEDGNKVKIRKKDVERIIGECMPHFEYTSTLGGDSSIFSALEQLSTHLGWGNLKNAFKAVREVWLQKLITRWENLSGGLKVDLTAKQVEGLYNTSNITERRLLMGNTPIAVTVYWTDEKTYNTYATDYGTDKVKSDQPVIHTSTIYVPYSTIESVSTLTTRYTYDPTSVEKIYTYDITKYQNAGGGIRIGAADKDNQSDELESILSDLAMQRTALPDNSVFDLTRLRELLGDERDIETLASAIAEIPGSGDLANLILCALEYEGVDVQTALSLYAEGKYVDSNGTAGVKKETNDQRY